jgi:hypothetical protein
VISSGTSKWPRINTYRMRTTRSGSDTRTTSLTWHDSAKMPSGLEMVQGREGVQHTREEGDGKLGGLGKDA